MNAGRGIRRWLAFGELAEALNAAMAYDHLHDQVRVNMVVPGGGGMRMRHLA